MKKIISGILIGAVFLMSGCNGDKPEPRLIQTPSFTKDVTDIQVRVNNLKQCPKHTVVSKTAIGQTIDYNGSANESVDTDVLNNGKETVIKACRNNDSAINFRIERYVFDGLTTHELGEKMKDRAE